MEVDLSGSCSCTFYPAQASGVHFSLVCCLLECLDLTRQLHPPLSTLAPHAHLPHNAHAGLHTHTHTHHATVFLPLELGPLPRGSRNRVSSLPKPSETTPGCFPSLGSHSLAGRVSAFACHARGTVKLTATHTTAPAQAPPPQFYSCVPPINHRALFVALFCACARSQFRPSTDRG